MTQVVENNKDVMRYQGAPTPIQTSLEAAYHQDTCLKWKTFGYVSLACGFNVHGNKYFQYIPVVKL